MLKAMGKKIFIILPVIFFLDLTSEYINPYPANIFFVLKMFSALYVYFCIYSNALETCTFTMEGNTMNTDQTAPRSSLIWVHSICKIGVINLRLRGHWFEHHHKGTVLSPWARHFILCLVQFQPEKHPDMTQNC